MENITETTIVYRGYIGNNGKYNGNYYSILGLYRDNGKEHGNHRNYREYIGVVI